VVSSFSFAFVEYNFNVITGPVEEHSPPELFALVGITGNTGLFTTGIYGIVKVSFNSPGSHRNPLRCHSSSPRSSAPFSSSTAWPENSSILRDQSTDLLLPLPRSVPVDHQ